jgi:RNA polymerase sigma-70 factor (ECF subfamily)
VSWLVGAVPTTQVLLRMPADPRQPIPFAGPRVSTAMASDPFDFEVFFLAHRASVEGYFLRLTGDRDLAKDLAQDTFLAAWKGYATLARHPEPVRWLFKVASHRASDYFRKLRRQKEEAIPLSDDLVSPERGIEDQMADRDTIDRAIRRLPPAERQAWLLCEVQEFSRDEIAEILSTTKGAVTKALWRARERLRKLYLLEDDQDKEEDQP